MPNEDEDFEIDDLFKDNKNKKKVNSGSKGKRGERDLGKILTERFPNCPPFTRSIGSGNRIRQVKMSKEASEIFASDLVCPPGFRYAIECKYGYESIDLAQAIATGNSLLDGFLQQGLDAATAVGKQPLVCWRKPRKNWIAFSASDVSVKGNRIIYTGWVGVPLKNLLELPDSHFFTE